MARGRPAMPLGTWGAIRVRQVPSGSWKADTWLRKYNGDKQRVTASGRSKSAAEQHVKKRCQELLGVTDTEQLRSDSPLENAIQQWLGELDVRDSTKDRYRACAQRHIYPSIGNVRLNECTTHLLESWIKSLAPGTANNCRSVLAGTFTMLSRWGLVFSNPMQNVSSVRSTSKVKRALKPHEVEQFRKQIALSGDQVLIDVLDLCLVTGLRAGEVLALRWQDVHLDRVPPVVEVTGTLSYSKARGNYRSDEAKTKTSHRTIQLGANAVAMLKRRRLEHGDYFEPVFPSASGSYIWENNFNRKLRKWRGEQFNWVTVHTLRKTLATLVADELGVGKATEVLGHANSVLTEQVYIVRSETGVPIGDLADGFLKVSKKQLDIPAHVAQIGGREVS